MKSSTWMPTPDQPLCIEVNGTYTVINSSFVTHQGTTSYLDNDSSDLRITHSALNNETMEINAVSVPDDSDSTLNPGYLPVNGLHLNDTPVVPCPNGSGGPPPIPEDMTFTEEKFMSVIVYCCIFIIAAIGNLTVFITLFRNR